MNDYILIALVFMASALLVRLVRSKLGVCDICHITVGANESRCPDCTEYMGTAF